MKIAITAALLALSTLVHAQDAHTVVPLDAEERAHVLGEMRGFLVTLEKATSALARNDFDALAAIADPASAPGAARMPPNIAKKLPMAFRKLAFSTHQQIDAIAADAAKRDPRHSLEQTARLLQTCNACHAAYRFP